MLRAKVHRFREEHDKISNLGDVVHLVRGNHAADVQQSDAAATWIRDAALPLVLAPAVEEVDGPTPDPGEVLDPLWIFAVMRRGVIRRFYAGLGITTEADVAGDHQRDYPGDISLEGQRLKIEKQFDVFVEL